MTLAIPSRYRQRVDLGKLIADRGELDHFQHLLRNYWPHRSGLESPFPSSMDIYEHTIIFTSNLFTPLRGMRSPSL